MSFHGDLMGVAIGASVLAAVPIASMHSVSISLDGANVETTNMDSNRWRELLSTTKSMSVSGDGEWISDATQEGVIADVLSGSAIHCVLFFSDGQGGTVEDYFEGDFLFTNFAVSGDQGSSQTFSTSLESTGAVTITSA